MNFPAGNRKKVTSVTVSVPGQAACLRRVSQRGITVSEWHVVAFDVPVIVHGPVRSLEAREPYRIPLPEWI